MRQVTEWDETDLFALVQAEVQENLTLDCKRSAALTKANALISPERPSRSGHAGA